ncbi:hypothetical protein [Nocardioides coralli]|nr:hypothetical protein [Nocardioides coralli]QZY29957.1 hypothetical protein K6T13_04525 [Nocardioides coralli]
MNSGLFGVILTIVVMLAIAVLILLFEKRRAREIQRDLGRRDGDEQP